MEPRGLFGKSVVTGHGVRPSGSAVSGPSSFRVFFQEKLLLPPTWTDPSAFSPFLQRVSEESCCHTATGEGSWSPSGGQMIGGRQMGWDGMGQTNGKV